MQTKRRASPLERAIAVHLNFPNPDWSTIWLPMRCIKCNDARMIEAHPHFPGNTAYVLFEHVKCTPHGKVRKSTIKFYDRNGVELVP